MLVGFACVGKLKGQLEATNLAELSTDKDGLQCSIDTCTGKLKSGFYHITVHSSPAQFLHKPGGHVQHQETHTPGMVDPNMMSKHDVVCILCV